MKRIIIFLMICLVGILEAKHQIVAILNKSDLKFDHAYKVVNGKKIDLPALTARLQESSNKKKQHVLIEHTVGSEGLGITMHDAIGNNFNVRIDDQLTADIEFQRKKSKKFIKSPQSCKMSDGSYCARALLEHENSTLIASITYPHKEEGDLVYLVISGSKGNYQLSYQHAV